MRIAMIGTRGVPARYGGFETCVEEVGARLADRGHDVTVYCRQHVSAQGARPEHYRRMRLVWLPAMQSRTLETLSHTALSVAHVAARGADAAFVFNSANAPLLPALRARGIPVATHVDGLEWQRAKWSGLGKAYYRHSEAWAVRLSDALIADARGIADYYRKEFSAQTSEIAYGAPLIESEKPENIVAQWGLKPGEYHLVVARFEPENHVDVIVRGYAASQATKPLVVVGSAPYSDEYTKGVQAAADHRVRFLGGVWDQALLDELYACAFVYWHGHSVGGTNPSLLRAIGAGAATCAFDVPFNREVLGESGQFFTGDASVTALCEAVEADAAEVRRRGDMARQRAAAYDWDDVAAKYEELAKQLAAGNTPGPQYLARRSSTSVNN